MLNRSQQLMASGADKRKYPRVQARNVSAHLNVTDKSSPCVIQNISAGGVFIETREEQLIPSLLANQGDVAANLLLTITRDEQVAFAPPIKTGIRELVVTDVGSPLVSLEDVGGRTIHVRRNSDHHASLVRLNEQLKKINRRPATIVADDKTRTDEELLDSVNAGRIRATIVDDYIFDRWQKDLLKIAATNREVAVSQDGVLAWVTRKDAPALTSLLKDFFSTHKMTF